jgi:hypothetical protein
LRFNKLGKSCNRMSRCILDHLTEHVQEDCIAETIEQIEGAFALAAQRISPVQDRRDPPLLVERRKWDFEVDKFFRA